MLVGGAKQEFMIHKEIVTYGFPFFKVAVAESRGTFGLPIAMNSQRNGYKVVYPHSKNETSKIFKLPEDDAEIFAIYLQCVYQGLLDFSEEEKLDIEELMSLPNHGR